METIPTPRSTSCEARDVMVGCAWLCRCWDITIVSDPIRWVVTPIIMVSQQLLSGHIHVASGWFNIELVNDG